MRIERKLTFGDMDENIGTSVYTKKLTPEERISLLEELRYDLGEIAGYDYSRRFERTISIIDQNTFSFPERIIKAD